MNPDSQNDVNQAAYRRLKDRIRDGYPPGWFVAIADAQIVCDAASFPEVLRKAMDIGLTPAAILIVQAGVEYPEYADILVAGGRP